MPRFRFLAAGFAFGLASLATAAFAQAPTTSTTDPGDIGLRAYIQVLRSDVRAEKLAILAELMKLTEAEDAAFWPVYREYDVELSKIDDEVVVLIAHYAWSYDRMTDAIADRLARAALDLESRRHALKLKYYERIKVALSAKLAARFIQVESQLLTMTDLQISSVLPIIK